MLQSRYLTKVSNRLGLRCVPSFSHYRYHQASALTPTQGSRYRIQGQSSTRPKIPSLLQDLDIIIGRSYVLQSILPPKDASSLLSTKLDIFTSPSMLPRCSTFLWRDLPVCSQPQLVIIFQSIYIYIYMFSTNLRGPQLFSYYYDYHQIIHTHFVGSFLL